MINDLKKHIEVNRQIISLYPEYDTHVWSEEGSYLKGAAENIQVPVGGHNSLFSNTATIQAVLGALDKISKGEF